MVELSTPDRRVAGSIPVRVNSFHFTFLPYFTESKVKLVLRKVSKSSTNFSSIILIFLFLPIL